MENIDNGVPQPTDVAIEDPNLEVDGGEDVAEDVVEDAVVDENLTKQQKKMLKSLKIKFNGTEIEENLPFEIEDNPEAIQYMTKQLQLAKLSQHKSQEYAQLQSQLKDFVEQLRQNPRKILSDERLGIDLRKIASEILDEDITNAQKTPEQLEKERLETQLRELREEREREKEEAKNKEMERLTQQKYEYFNTQIDKAIESSNLPKSPYIVNKMVNYLSLGIRAGLNVEPSDVVNIIKEEMRSDLSQMFQVMPADVLNELLGDNYDKVRKHRLSKTKKPDTTAVSNKKVADIGKVDQPVKKEEKISFKDFFGV